MKVRVLLILLVICLTGGSIWAKKKASAQMVTEISAGDRNIKYIGRFDFGNPGKARFAWSASMIKARFEGTLCNVKLKEASSGNGFDNYFNVIIDDNEPVVVKLSPYKELYKIADDLSPGEHRLTIVKRTEIFCGAVDFLGLQIEEGKHLLPIDDSNSKKIEFIGDSITCGYGNEGKNKEEPFKDSTENAYMTYAAMTARNFDADFVTICRSGIGVMRNGDNSTKNIMPIAYKKTLMYHDTAWDFTTWTPDLVVVNLGSNDFAHSAPDERKFVKAYVDFVKFIKGNYPDTPVVCMIGPCMSDYWPMDKKTNKPVKSLTIMRGYMKKILKTLKKAGIDDVYQVEVTPQGEKLGYGSDWHPNVAQHRLNAAELTDFIKTTMQW